MQGASLIPFTYSRSTMRGCGAEKDPRISHSVLSMHGSHKISGEPKGDMGVEMVPKQEPYG